MHIPVLSSLFKQASQRVGWFAICTNSNGVSIAHVKHSKGSLPRVMVCTFHPLENITSPTLEKLRKDAHIANFQFITLLAPSEYQILMVEAPNVPPEEMKTAIRWHVKDSLNYHIDDAVVDVLQVPSGKAGGDRPQSVYAVASSRDTINKHATLFEKAKINLKAIDIPELAQRNIAALFEEEGRCLALLAFDDNGGMLTFTCGGELYLARHIEITLGQLQDADEELRQQYLDRVELETQRSLDYFGRQYSYMVINRLLVSAPEHLGLVQWLAPHLEVLVEQIDLSKALDISGVPELVDSEYVAHVFLALGAALRQDRRTE